MFGSEICHAQAMKEPIPSRKGRCKASYCLPKILLYILFNHREIREIIILLSLGKSVQKCPGSLSNSNNAKSFVLLDVGFQSRRLWIPQHLLEQTLVESFTPPR